MPVGAWELEYGCTTLADPNRVAAYVANAQDPAYCVDGVNALAPVPPAWTNLRVNCNCSALNYTADYPGQQPYEIAPYTTPADDIAPWYSSLNPESAHFYGFMIESLEEVASPPVSRNIVDRVSVFGGGAFGSLRKRGRTMKVTLLAFGAYETAMDYGFRWLSDILTSESAPCDLCEVTVRTGCPILENWPPSWDNWDTGRWTFKQVGIIDGPRYEDPPNPDAVCNVRRVSFVLTASVPYAFKCPEQQASAVEWIDALVPQDWNDLSSATLWFDAAANNQDSEVRNLGVGGSALNGVYGSGTDAPTWLDHTGTNYVHIPRHETNYLWISTTDSTNLPNNFEVSARVTLDSYGTADSVQRSILSKGYLSGTRSWEIYVRDGKLGFRTSSDGTGGFVAHESTANIPQTEGQPFWFKVNVSSTQVIFSTAPDQSSAPTTSEWTQLGTAVTLTGSIFLVDSDLYVGRGPYGTGNGVGYLDVYRIVMKDNGSTILNLDVPNTLQSGRAKSLATRQEFPQNIAQIVGNGIENFFGLTDDGKVFGWGLNSWAYYWAGTVPPSYSRLGISEPLNASKEPVWIKTGALNGQTVQQLAMTYEGVFALRDDGVVVAWGQSLPVPGGTFGGVVNTPTAYSAGALSGAVVTRISAGAQHIVALLDDGSVVTWGWNQQGQLGNGTFVDNMTPTVVSGGYLAGKTAIDVFAGAQSSYALLSDGTVAAWGQNDDGHLADGTTTDRPLPVQGVLGGAATGKTITKIYTQTSHSDTIFATTVEGVLLGWGWNGSGNVLGQDPGLTEYTSPIAISNGALTGKTVIDGAQGNYGESSYAITSDGDLIAWGNTAQGGDGNYPYPIYPYSPDTQLPTPTLIDIAAFTGDTSGVQFMACQSDIEHHYVIVMNSGRVFSWGANMEWQSGSDESPESPFYTDDYASNPDTITYLEAYEVTGVLKSPTVVFNRGSIIVSDYVPTIAAVVRPIWLFAPKQYIRIPHNSLLNFSSATSLTISIISRTFAPTDSGYFVSSFNNPVRRNLVSKAAAPLSTSSLGWRVAQTIYDDQYMLLYRVTAAQSGDLNNTTTGMYGPTENRALNIAGIVRRDDGYLRCNAISEWGTSDVFLDGIPPTSMDNSADIYIGYNPLDPTTGANSNSPSVTPNSYTSLEVAGFVIWRYAHTVETLKSTLTSYLLEDPNTASPGVDWFCNNESKSCVSVTPSQAVGEDALVVEVQADPDRPISDLVITVTPDPFGYVCDPTTAPAGYVAPEPCDIVTVRELPAGYVLRYDATTQTITVTSPGGNVEDGTPYLDVSSGIGPSFPSIRGGAFCVCVSSARCSFNASTSNFSVWTVHQELGL